MSRKNLEINTIPNSDIRGTNLVFIIGFALTPVNLFFCVCFPLYVQALNSVQSFFIFILKFQEKSKGDKTIGKVENIYIKHSGL
jgi:hypothetical protein